MAGEENFLYRPTTRQLRKKESEFSLFPFFLPFSSLRLQLLNGGGGGRCVIGRFV